MICINLIKILDSYRTYYPNFFIENKIFEKKSFFWMYKMSSKICIMCITMRKNRRTNMAEVAPQWMMCFTMP